MIFVVAYQLALLLPHSARNRNIRIKFSRNREDNQQQTQPMLGCIGKENEKEERKKKTTKQKYTVYYRLHYKCFLIIHPADDWFILLWLPDGVSLPFEYFRKQFREDKARQYLVFYSVNKYMNGSSKQTSQRTYLSFFVFHNHARLNQ